MNENENSYEASIYNAQLKAEELSEIFELDKRRYITPLNEEDEL